jgi:hypothetical protein
VPVQKSGKTRFRGTKNFNGNGGNSAVMIADGHQMSICS